MSESSPKWQVINALTARIVAGELAPGSYIGTIESLADQFQVTTGAVRVALEEMRGTGWVEARGRAGHFVSRHVPDVTPAERVRRMPMGRLRDLEERVLKLERALNSQ